MIPNLKTESRLLIDRDKLIQSMHKISTFLMKASAFHEISHTQLINEYPYTTTRLSELSHTNVIMAKILDEVVDTLGFDRGFICVLDDEKENLVTRVLKNYDQEEAERAFSINFNMKKHNSLETMVVKTGQYIILEDSEMDPRITRADRKITMFYKRGSNFYAPLIVQGEVTGLISVWTKEKIQFTPEEINILLTFSNQVSIIINTILLFENKGEKIKQLCTLQSGVSELNASTSLDDMHGILLKRAMVLGKADMALLYIINAERNECRIYDGEKVIIEDKDEYSRIIAKSLDDNEIKVQRHTSSHSVGMDSIFDGCSAEIVFPFKIKNYFKGALCLGKIKGAYSQDNIKTIDILVKNASSSYSNAIMNSILFQEAKSLKSEVEKLKKREDLLLGFENIIGNSQQIKDIFNITAEVAKHDTNILISGESGVGKELIARAIHRTSERAKRRFVAVNCAAIPGTLLESELFGYEAGAFTDAKKRKVGLLEYANGGTFLLDEIGDMSLPLQAKFLRVLEDGCVRRLGASENIRIDVRFIFSTNKDLSQMVAAGSFRADLFYRIRVVPIIIPPLRERTDDILLLANHYVDEFNRKFNKKIRGFSKEAEDVLTSYHWPGNVRELKNIIERVMISQNLNEIITPDNLPSELNIAKTLDITRDIGKFLNQISGVSIDYMTVVDRLNLEIRGEMLRKALSSSNGNKSAAARLLSISRHALERELKKISRKTDSKLSISAQFDRLPLT